MPSLDLTTSTKPILIDLVLNNVSRSELGTYLWEEHSRQEGKRSAKAWEGMGHRIHIHFILPVAYSSIFPLGFGAERGGGELIRRSVRVSTIFWQIYCARFFDRYCTCTVSFTVFTKTETMGVTCLNLQSVVSFE